MKKIISILIISIFLISLSSVYAADGDVLWEKIGPNGYVYDVAVDSKDNIIIVQDVGTRKYDPNGNLLKEISFGYNGVAVDSKDNIIITGGIGTRKYDPNGNLLKEISFNGNDVAVDSNDNIIIAGASTRKYDPNGNLLAEISFYGYRVAVDSKDNILIDNGSFTTRKYSSTGTSIWEKTFDSGYTQYLHGIATDSFDNVIVSGYNSNPVSWASIIVKYSPTGTKLWDIIDGTDSRWSYGAAVDSYNNIIVAGGRETPSNNYDWLTKKYDPNGKKIWERALDFKGGSDQGWAVAVDSKNNIIVTGWVYDGGTVKSYTVKYGGVTPRSKSLPIAKILEILKRNKEK